MKKLLALLMAVALCMGLLAGVAMAEDENLASAKGLLDFMYKSKSRDKRHKFTLGDAYELKDVDYKPQNYENVSKKVEEREVDRRRTCEETAAVDGGKFFAECDRDSVIRRVAVYRRDLRKENHDDGNYCQKRADERNKFVQ